MNLESWIILAVIALIGFIRDRAAEMWFRRWQDAIREEYQARVAIAGQNVRIEFLTKERDALATKVAELEAEYLTECECDDCPPPDASPEDADLFDKLTRNPDAWKYN